MNSTSEQINDCHASMEQALAFQEAALGKLQIDLCSFGYKDAGSATAGACGSLNPAVQEPRLSPPERYRREIGESQALLM